MGSVEIAPDAILTCVEVNFEKPEVASSDQRTGWVRGPEEASDPMERTQPCVALTFRERLCVDVLTLPTLIAGAADGTNAAICTLTLGGTVTVTVCRRLLDDPCCALAGRDIIAVPIEIAIRVRRSLTIDRASSCREP